MQAEQLEDAELGSDHRHAGAPDLVRDLVEIAHLDLAAQHLQAPLLQLPGNHLLAVGDVLGHRADHRGVDLQLAPRHFGAELLAERPGELLLLHQLELEEVRAETAAVKDLPVQRFLESFRSEMPAMDEQLADLHHLPSG